MDAVINIRQGTSGHTQLSWLNCHMLDQLREL